MEISPAVVPGSGNASSILTNAHFTREIDRVCFRHVGSRSYWGQWQDPTGYDADLSFIAIDDMKMVPFGGKVLLLARRSAHLPAVVRPSFGISLHNI